jgi:hypothetical protein
MGGLCFTEVPSSLLPLSVALVAASLAWGENTTSARVYRNDGDGVFVDINAGLVDNEGSSASWGDFNNDGLLDILRGPRAGARIYLNQGEGKFFGINTGILGAIDGITAWGDMDNNGTLDLLKAIIDSHVAIYRNISSRTNRPPGPPPGLRSSVNSHGTVLLEWDPAVDPDQDDGLTYSVRIGTSPGAENVVPPGAHLPSGRPLLPVIGNCGSRMSYVIKGLPPGQYFWSAQAVDHGYAGSPFAPEATFLISSRIIHAGFTNEQFTLSYTGIAGRSYALEASGDLASWSPVATNIASSAGTLIDTQSSTAEARFYRIRLLP